MTELEFLQHVNFNWVVDFNDVWRTPAVDVPGFHENLRAAFASKLDAMRQAADDASPLGWIIAGSGGTGKTHLLGAFRRETTQRGLPFIMVDMTDVRSFWDSVLQGYVGSLQARIDDGAPQYKMALGNVIDRLGPNKPTTDVLTTLAERRSRHLRDDMNKVLAALNKIRPRETLNYQNVIRALICLNSEDFTLSSLGLTWLQGVELEEEDKRELGFTVRGEPPRKIIEALSWMLSLGGPTVLAFDQLDPIVTELHHRRLGAAADEGTATAEAIITEIGGGLGALREITKRTLAILSCVETTWEYLRSSVLRTFVDRFEPPLRLATGHEKEIGPVRAQALIGGRLAAAHRASGFQPPYPTFPFRLQAFQALHSFSPRELLQRCDAHIKQCLYDGQVIELESFAAPATVSDPPKKGPSNGLEHLDAEFQKLRAEARPAWLLEEKHDDDRLAPLILSGLKSLVEETEFGPDVTPQIDAELTGGAKTRPLHARLRLIFHKDNEREEHFCVRALQWTNDRAFQARLKAALTQSGIDRSLKFRRLAIVRSFPDPNGKLSKQLIDELRGDGGVFINPDEDDLRALSALHQLSLRKDPNVSKWLKTRRPASSLGLIQAIVGNHPIFQGSAAPPPVVEEPKQETVPAGASNGQKPTAANGQPAEPSGKSGGGGPTPPDPIDKTPPVASDFKIPLGRRIQGGKPTEVEVRLPIEELARHTMIIGGSGSGKTVLLKRLIEEAAVEGVSTVVIDGANDIAALDERWDEPPSSWTETDHKKADAYHVPGRVVFWTPGGESGNPISMEPVPDLAPLASDPEELGAAVSMVVETLASRVVKGASKSNNHKLAILNNTLLYLARHGGGRLQDLVDLLGDLPPEAGANIGGEARLAAGMADDLKAAIVLDPLLRSTGDPIDPSVLFGLDQPGKPARVSVISLARLPGLEAQRNFLNQLTISLFSWLKKSPHYGGRPLRGLFVIDEARDYAPSQRASACGAGLLRLAAQSRKYGLGLIFATQNPKDIDNKIVGNCSSHFYGKMNSPATIEATRDMIRLKGGAGEDVPRLAAGEFYFHNANIGLQKPTKIKTSMCLSRHPVNPLDEATVLEKAAASRVSLAPGAAVS